MRAATEAYHATMAEDDWGFEHQQDAYEAGYEAGVFAERAHIRAEIDERRERYWDGKPDGYVWFDDLYNMTAPNLARDRE